MAKHADFHNFMRKQTTAKYNYNYYYCFRHVVDIICSFTEICVYLILYSLLFKLYRIDLLFYIILYYTCVWDHTGFCCCCLFVVVFLNRTESADVFVRMSLSKALWKLMQLLLLLQQHNSLYLTLVEKCHFKRWATWHYICNEIKIFKIELCEHSSLCVTNLCDYHC